MTRLRELAGRLRERIRIERREAARDAAGGATGEWQVVADSWAAIEPGGGSVTIVGDAIRGRLRWTVTVRSETDLAVDDRIVWRKARLRVRRVTPDPREPDRTIAETEEEA